MRRRKRRSMPLSTKQLYDNQKTVVFCMPGNRFSENLDARPGPVGQKISPGQLVPGKSQPPWPNELEGYASMNCIMTLSALTVEAAAMARVPLAGSNWIPGIKEKK